MAEQDDSSKTEPPTAKSLRDARKKGDVPKAPDIGITLGFFFALLLLWLVFEDLVLDIMTLVGHVLNAPAVPFVENLESLGAEAIDVLLGVTALVIIPLALFGLVVEFLVVGPVITAEKFKPRMSHMNPVRGLKRMFGPDNLVDLIKSIVKTLILALVALYAVSSVLGDLLLLPSAKPEQVVSGIWYLMIRIFGWVSAFYFLFMFVDTGYQHRAFMKKMKMSIRDIRDELKAIEGDPLLRGARRELGNEWSQEAPEKAAREASVIVVNPTHVAIAIHYDAQKTRLPLITARGELHLAGLIRRSAETAGVPVLRNEKLARALLVCETVDNYVPREFFNIIAEVILWSQATRELMAAQRSGDVDRRPLNPPGEDLTNYQLARVGAGVKP